MPVQTVPQLKPSLTLHPCHPSREGSHFPRLQLSDIFHIDTFYMPDHGGDVDLGPWLLSLVLHEVNGSAFL